MKSSLKKLVLVILTGAAFGSSVVASRIALNAVSPFVLIIFRFGIAALLYAFTLPLLKKQLLTGGRKYLDILIVGIASFGLPLLLFFFALAFISSGMFSVLFASIPIFTAVIAHLTLKNEKISKKLLFGLATALLGVIYLFATKTSGLTIFDVKGPLLVMIGVLISSTGTVYARAHLSHDDPLVVSALQTMAAFLVLSIIVFSLGKFQLGPMSTISWVAIIYNSIAGSYIGFWLTFTLIKRYGATAGALSSYIMPAVSGFLGAVLLGEVVSLSLVVGAILIFLGIFFAA